MTTLPFLLMAQLAFLLGAARRAGALVWPLLLLAGVLLVWGAASTALALNGIYDDPRLLALLPGFWLSAVPFVLVAVTILAVAPLRAALWSIATAVPEHWFVGIQVLRLAALGTLIKTVQGAFPLTVEAAIGLTDIAFGLSALLLYRLARNGRLSPDALMIWHLVGALLVLIPGGLSIQTNLPGPLHIVEAPDVTGAIFDFPMVLAPSLVVPVFLMLNLLGAFAAYTKMVDAPRARRRQAHSAG